MAKTMDDLREMMCDELDEIVKKDSLDMAQLEQVYKIVDIIKDIDEIGMGESGYSQQGRMPVYYDYGNSYQNRNGNGRYSRNGGGNSYRNGGYSREADRERTIDKLERMMDDASTEHEREAIRRILETM